MKREPSTYSRLLVFLALVTLLVVDLFVGLPDGAFLGVGAVVFAVAAVVHASGGETRAAAAWILFGIALGVVALVDVGDDVLLVFAVVVLLLAGFVLLVSQRATATVEE